MTTKLEKKFKSLVVDDDPVVRDALSEILKDAGYIVDVAADGVEALRKVKTFGFDSVLSDIWMPDMNGIDLLKQIKKYDFTLPVVMVTGCPDISLAVEAIKEGASDFITKPIKIEQVELIIERLIKERRLLLENVELKKKVERKRTIEELNTKLNNKVMELSALYSISETFSEALEEEDIFQKVVDLACEITEAGTSCLMIIDRESKELIVKAAKGIDSDVTKGTRIPIGSGIAGKVALGGKHLLINSLSRQPCSDNCKTIYNTDSYISVPLKIKNEIFGVLNVGNGFNGHRFSEDEVYLLLALAKKAALSIENTILYDSIYNNLMNSLRAMVNAIEARDKYTKRHSQRVTLLAMDIAREMGCSNEDVETIKLGGFLHDIGKIGIRDSILLKPERLSQKEFEVIKSHPVIGEKIIEPLGIIPVEKSIIRHHHERWDGKGYPDGLSGIDIPLPARILSVADAFDAMTTDRPYRGAMSKDASLTEIEGLSGFQFDSDIVKTFKKVLEQNHTRRPVFEDILLPLD